MSHKLTRFEALCRRASACRQCFTNIRSLKAPTIDIAQPRWVGRKYRRTRPRVLVLMLNPGSGESRTDSADCKARRLIRAFAAGECTLRDVLGHIQADAKNWGRGRFIDFYSTDLGLNFERLAFANVAWCSTRGNHYPPEMLHTCFTRHTSELLQILRPDIVLLSGASVRRFAKKINKLLPSATIITTFHFAHRKGKQAWLTEAARVRRRIQVLSKKS